MNGHTETRPAVEGIGSAPVLLWGLDAQTRLARLADKAGLPLAQAGEGQLLANLAYAFDPVWLGHTVASPGLVVTCEGVPALAHCRTAEEAALIRRAMEHGVAATPPPGMTVVAIEDNPQIENRELRKRTTPFLMPVRADTQRAFERASYFGAYKGVTDILTKYLWPEWALVLTRIAARLHITPNQVTFVGAVLCVLATVCFAKGQYWLGMALGLGFMVLDTVDGKLARCTITSSKWGNIADHGMDLIHPPFWWWFWATGLVYWNLALPERTFWLVQGALLGGYVLQRVIEGIFIAQNGGIHIHVWRRFDSWFRLITARRNPNMVILFVSMLFARPDWGIIAVAWWTVISLLVHCVQLLQAWLARARGEKIVSWLVEG